MQTSPKTSEILKWFGEISKVPRQSKNEAKIGEWLVQWAKTHRLNAKTDAAGNVLIHVPASKGREDSPVLILQGHMDMVCDKTPDSTHDFSKDPIELVHDGEWLRARNTTLGADNGIAMAMGLALALDKDASHPPLELLFTVDEETGLTGALSLEPGFVTGKTLLNLDSEDEGVLTIGCAGGKTSQMALPLSFASAPYGLQALRLKVSGLQGGHSGAHIKDQRANAIKVVCRCLAGLLNESTVRLIDIKGGSAHNAIPRDAEALVVVEGSKATRLRECVKAFEKTAKAEYSHSDAGLAVCIEDATVPYGTKICDQATSRKVIAFVQAMPHGVASMSAAIQGLVETSNNLATIKFEADAVHLVSSQRSSVMSRRDELCGRIAALVELASGSVSTSDGYPSWEPNWDSKLLARCKDIYKKRFGKDAVVDVIHGGLECGIIGSKYLGMEMISIGPTIRNPHTPTESLLLPTVDKVWDFLLDILKA